MKKKWNREMTGNVIAYVSVFISFMLVTFFTPVLEEGANYGIWTMLPPLLVFLFIVPTHRIIEGFFWTALLTVYISTRSGLIGGFVDAVFNNITNPDGWWILMLFLLGGIVTATFKISGAGTYFARWIAKKAKSSKFALFSTSAMCIPLAIDDYTSTLVVGNVMTPLTDEYKVPREMMAYVLRASSANIAAIVPIGAWAVYFGSVLEMWDGDMGILGESSGLMYYLGKVLPVCFYPIVCVLLCWMLIAFIKPFGLMKKAYSRVEKTGNVVPESKPRYIDGVLQEPPEPEKATEPRAKCNLSHFIVPIAAILVFGWTFEWDMIYGLTWGLITTFVYYCITGVFEPIDAINSIIDGLGSMAEMCTMCTLGLVICNGLADIGFIDYVVSVVSGIVSPAFLPLIVFIAFSLTEMLVTFNYTLYLIAVPIVAGVAIATGASVPLTLAALMSSGLWGYQVAFSSDGGILACAATGGIDLYDQTFAQYAYSLVPWGISAILFTVCGFLL